MSVCQGLLLNQQPIPVPLALYPKFFFHHTHACQWRLSSFAKIGGMESIVGNGMKLSSECKDASILAFLTPLQSKFSVTVSARLDDEKKKEKSHLLPPTSVVIPYGNRQIKLETGLIGRQANGSITITDGETILYTSICMAEEMSEPSDFVPLTVHYQERFSAAGRTSRAFYKREGRAKDREVLICRLIDRPLRPMMAKGLNHETQILSWVFSYDGVHSPEPLAITAAGAALALSDIPSTKVVAAVRVGMVNEELIVNPTVEQLENSKLDMILACTTDAVVMIEGYCDFLTEDELTQAVSVGQEAASRVCEGIEELVKKAGKLKKTEMIQLPPPIIYSYIEKLVGEKLLNALQIETKKARKQALSSLEERVLALLTGSDDGIKQLCKAKEDTIEIDEADQVIEDGEVDQGDLHLKPVIIKPLPELFDPTDVKLVFKEVTSKLMRQLIVQSRKRSDGRSVAEIRKVQSLCGLLPRSHGSSLFTRGETQAIAVTTLGGHDMGQRLDNLMDTDIKRFYFQYTFPPSAVGETGRVGVPSRREIGHGMLAERALEPALPSSEEFPYTIRVESTITESNGSSSMASVCGGCLAMLDAGVPLKCFVGGVAMGLILNTREYGGDGEPLILSDITGAEDALGDMDLKIAGSDFGITAFQMDTKVDGIKHHVVQKALIQAKEARCCVLGEMRKCKPPPTRSLSKHAPLIEVMKVDPEKVNVLIGSAGKTVKSIIELSGADTVTIEDDGVVQIVAKSLKSLESAKSRILGLALEPTVGTIYRDCIVKSIVSFGCFIEIAPGREGLCHISELSTQRLPKAEDFVNVGDRLDVKLIEINSKGQLRLSHRAVLLDGQQKAQGKERSTMQVNDKKGLENTNKELVGASDV
eukprot:c29100_g1_i1 orf=631-3255(+)